MARILIMEDEPTIAMIFEIALSEEGHEVITVANGKEGLEVLKQAPIPDIVLVDLFMPILDEKKVVETMRSNSKLKDVPVIIVSGSIAGFGNFPPQDSYHAHISKPFDLEEVIETVASFPFFVFIHSCSSFTK